MSPRKLLELDEKVDDNEVQRTKTDEVKEVKTKKASKHSKKQRQASNQKLSKPLGEADLLKSSGVDIFQRSPQHKVIYPYKRQKKSKQQEPTTVLDSSSEDNSSSDDDKENVVVTPVRERNMQRRTINLEGDQLKQFKNAAERYGFLENTFPDKQEISVMSRKIALDILGLPSDTRVIISEDLEKTFTTSIRTKRSNILNYNLPKFLKKYPFDMTLIPEEYQQPRQYLYNYITETGR
ncbi:hypothetical protein BDA99DRAFT_224812 [Phascolomyces articulosus]|uniref:Uncharacterized protein n=1 Tax=Phascolomyces articulosus TaxID=60185 RepID=A0AAD5JZU6_9FUNG|nr:hypothetical protein BDA99DRAFT_224812 [Phascolomyces articulosus]